MVVQDLNGRDRHLRGVEPGPDEAAEAVQHGLDVDLAHALQRVPAKKVSTATSSPVALTCMCRSRYSGSNRSNAWICSSLSLIFRFRAVSASRRGAPMLPREDYG